MAKYNGPRRKTKLAIFARDQWRCGYCGIEVVECTTSPAPPNAATVDHIVARSAGGGNQRANLVTACLACNQAKGGQHRLHDHSDASKNLAVAYALVRALSARPAKSAILAIPKEALPEHLSPSEGRADPTSHRRAGDATAA